MPTKHNVSIYQLKVTLKHSKPPIWRRIQVKEDATLYKLHQTIQVAMGWTNSHLHQFIADGVYYPDSPDTPSPCLAELGERRDHRTGMTGDWTEVRLWEHADGEDATGRLEEIYAKEHGP